MPPGGPLMALKKFKPTSPGRRFMTVSKFEEVTRSKPEKSLTGAVRKKGGRNNAGRITTRHKGGGHKRRYREIDFKRTKDGVPAKVAAVCASPRESYGASRSPAARPSARSGTSTTRTSPAGRPAAAGGAASVRRSAARP